MHNNVCSVSNLYETTYLVSIEGQVVDAIITGIVILVALIGSFNGVIASLNELHQTRRDINVLQELNVVDSRRDIVVYEWWRHFLRLIGFFAFFAVAIIMVLGYNLAEDISPSRLIVRMLILIGILSMTGNSWVDRRARKKVIQSIQ